MSKSAAPAGYHTVTPYLVLEDVPGFLAWAEDALGAAVVERVLLPTGEIAHAEIQLGDSRVMIGSARGGRPAQPGFLHLYVADCDAAFERAVQRGAQVVQPVADQFYGDRSGGAHDPYGNLWWWATRREELKPEEIQRRMSGEGP